MTSLLNVVALIGKHPYHHPSSIPPNNPSKASSQLELPVQKIDGVPTFQVMEKMAEVVTFVFRSSPGRHVLISIELEKVI